MSAHPVAIVAGPGRLAARLKREIDGDVLFDAASRGRYATDASIYQVTPVGVVVPRSAEAAIAAMQIAHEEGVATLHARAQALARRLEAGLRAIEGVAVWGPGASERAVPVVSFVIEGEDPSLVAMRLEDDWGMRLRVGLHCAPAAHRRLGTFPGGTVRASPGPLNAEVEIDGLIAAVTELAAGAR